LGVTIVLRGTVRDVSEGIGSELKAGEAILRSHILQAAGEGKEGKKKGYEGESAQMHENAWRQYYFKLFDD